MLKQCNELRTFRRIEILDKMSATEVLYQSVPLRDSFSETLKKADDIIIFNVGGTKFEVLKSNFAYWPTTRLSRLVRANTEEEILSLCEGFRISTAARGNVSKKEYYWQLSISSNKIDWN